MEKRTLAIFAVSCKLFLSTSLFAQQQRVDTARTYFIPEITVSDIYQTREVRSTAPLQIFSKDALKNLNALQVSDAVKHFAGVTVKDYGGIGGLKTISIRSLGAQHTAVGYDGITLTDCQTGQIDLGRFSLDNVDQLSLSNGQSDNIFQPARFFASAGILNIQTLTPRFEDGKRTNKCVFQDRFMGIGQSQSVIGTTDQSEMDCICQRRMDVIGRALSIYLILRK